ncbi:MAG: hypothetical protein JWM28_3943 [Chitinophagaceae bacterium]|nr:hypothetical protein [Chitinophagaceae bacterium]
MTDKVRKYLSENYDQLSPEGPDEKVWRNISKLIPERRGKLFFIGLKKLAVACVIILIAISAYFFAGSRRKQINETTSTNSEKSEKSKEQMIPLIVKENKKEKIEPPEIKKSLAAVIKKKQYKIISPDKRPPQRSVNVPIEQLAFQYESSLTRVIEDQKTTISTTPVYGVTQDYFDLFIKEYRSLELNENRIREKKRLSTESVDALDKLDEMILNFQKKIRLLKRLRAEIEKVNKANKPKQANQDVQINYVRII